DLRAAIELDEFDTGYPRMRLANLYDVVALIHAAVGKEDPGGVYLRSHEFGEEQKKQILLRVQTAAKDASNVLSWRALLGKLSRLMRLNVFDHPKARPVDYHS